MFILKYLSEDVIDNMKTYDSKSGYYLTRKSFKANKCYKYE